MNQFSLGTKETYPDLIESPTHSDVLSRIIGFKNKSMRYREGEVEWDSGAGERMKNGFDLNTSYA